MKIHNSLKKKRDVNIPYKMRYDYDGVFNDFYEVFKDKRHINLDFFFYRLNGLKIIPISEDSDFINKGTYAEYKIHDNKIKINMKMFKSSIMHEILHLSSSVKGKNCVYSGFLQYDKKTKVLIGMGLNEAYTNYLDKKYFGNYGEDKQEDLRYTYPITTSIISILEDFVGQEKMEEWYFKADLKSLIDYLCQYRDLDECEAFVMALDNLFYLVDNGVIKHPKLASDSYKYIVNFLGRCYMDLYIEEYYKGNYDRNELMDRLRMTYGLMRKHLTFSKLKIPFSKKISKESFQAYVLYEKNKVLKKCA